MVSFSGVVIIGCGSENCQAVCVSVKIDWILTKESISKHGREGQVSRTCTNFLVRRSDDVRIYLIRNLTLLDTATPICWGRETESISWNEQNVTYHKMGQISKKQPWKCWLWWYYIICMSWYGKNHHVDRNPVLSFLWAGDIVTQPAGTCATYLPFFDT